MVLGCVLIRLMGSFLITRIRQARRSYHDALVEVQRATAAKHRLQVSGDTGVVNRPTHQCHVLTTHISPLLRQPHTQGVIGKEHKLAEAEAALGRAQQGAEEAKRAYEVVCTRFLSDFDRCVFVECMPWRGRSGHVGMH